MRQATINRKTGETDIQLTLNLDGQGQYSINTGLPFFDHMLNLFAKHGRFDLTLQAKGDTEVDGHHTVEDVGICLGQAFVSALGNAAGIERYASGLFPMDETLCQVALDVCNRAYFHFEGDIPTAKAGDFDTELLEEFFRAFAMNARITLHLSIVYGKNAHHILESAFKGIAVCLFRATRVDPERSDIPSTKGML